MLIAVLVAGAVRVALGVYSLRGQEVLFEGEDLPKYASVLAATGGMLLVVGACYRLHVVLQILVGAISYLALLLFLHMLQKKQHGYEKKRHF